MYLVQVSLLLIDLQGLVYFFRPLPPIASKGLSKFYANTEGKQQIQRQLLLVQYKQQANPL
jgi:hypothetical protein